ncbi:hypothetical protein [Metabacillus fastidiosus]|uniref:hypothetical protein n=1 Tax=Metabacillus fastidiosus TaxID=1458 RepID=UPI003D2BEA0B
MKDVKFKICFISHEDAEILTKTLFYNLKALVGTEHKYNYETIILSSDSSRENDLNILALAKQYQIDEVRIRNRKKSLKYKGDPSNESHMSILSTNADYLIVIESDVILFKKESDFDLLKEIYSFFERNKDVGIAYKMSDHECWNWKLEDVDRELEDGVRNVNRVASHFLIYNLKAFNRNLNKNGNVFNNNYTEEFNYEDKISVESITQKKPIAFLEDWPIEVWHCDKKVSENSGYYTKDKELKMKMIDQFVSKFS